MDWGTFIWAVLSFKIWDYYQSAAHAIITDFYFVTKFATFSEFTYHIHTAHTLISAVPFHTYYTLYNNPRRKFCQLRSFTQKREEKGEGEICTKSQTSGLQGNNFCKSTKIQPFIDRGGYYGVPKKIPTFRIHCVNKNLANPSTVGILLTNLFGIYFLKFCYTLQILKSWIFNQLLCLADWTRRHDPDIYRDFQLRYERVS